MLKMITWPQYFGTVAVLLILYYLYVALVYYREELRALVGKKRVRSQATLTGTPTGIVGRGPLIPRSLVAPIVAPIEAIKAEAEPEPTAAEEHSAEVKEKARHKLDDENANDERKSENLIIDIKSQRVDINEKNTRFSKTELPAFSEAATLESEQDFTISITQLSDHFDRAAAGELTKQQLVQQVPALANTALMEAFYKTSKQKSQQLTTALFAEIPD